MYVGLTGGIGSGKSTLARLLAGLGAHVIDADVVARDVVDELAPRIGAELGMDLVPRGVLDRAALAQRMFSDAAARAWVESIVHPEVAARVARIRAGLPVTDVVIYDVALLAEKGMAGQFDAVIAVTAPLETRLERLAQRGMDRDDALARIAGQATDEQRAALANIVVDNSGTIDDLRVAAADIWRRLPTYA